MSVKVTMRQLELLSDLSKYFEALPEKSAKDLQLAMNKVGGGTGLTMFKREMNSQVNFPSNYLNGERFFLAKKANPNDLSIVVAGRGEPTSLARFVTKSKSKGLQVKVNAAGGGSNLRRAFLVKLNSGNQGLAVRVDKGQTALKNSTGAKRLTRNKTKRKEGYESDQRVFLLYAPSVDQIFREVSLTNSPEFLQMIEAEFLRQFLRDKNE